MIFTHIKERIRNLLFAPYFRINLAVITILGGFGGVFPLVFLGSDRTNPFVAFGWGVFVICLASPIWLPNIVFFTLSEPRDRGLDAIRIVNGTPPRYLWKEKLSDLVVEIPIAIGFAALVGSLGATISTVVNGASFTMLWEMNFSRGQFVIAVIVLVYTLLFCVFASEVFGHRASATAYISLSLFATIAVLIVMRFFAPFRILQLFSPWIPVWPIRPDQGRSNLFATSLSELQQITLMIIWLVIFVLLPALKPRTSQMPIWRQE